MIKVVVAILGCLLEGSDASFSRVLRRSLSAPVRKHAQYPTAEATAAAEPIMPLIYSTDEKFSVAAWSWMGVGVAFCTAGYFEVWPFEYQEASQDYFKNKCIGVYESVFGKMGDEPAVVVIIDEKQQPKEE